MAIGNRTFNSPEFIKKKKSRAVRRVVFFVSILVLLVLGFAGLTHWSKVSIDTVRVDGTVILSADDIKLQTMQFISGDYFYIFAKKNALLYPRAGLTTFLSQQYPRIQNIKVGLDNYHTIGITLSERQPFALWCDTPPVESQQTTVNSQQLGQGATSTASIASTTITTFTSSTTATPVSTCYFLDQSGFVFSHAPDFSGDAYFKYYGLLPFEAPIGTSYLAVPGKFTELSTFVAAVKALNITPLYIVAQSQDDFELYLYGGGKIIFDDHDPLDKIAERLATLLHTANLVPQKNGELLVEYIDLRYGNKLYYKVKS